MLTGKRFGITRPTVGVQTVDGKSTVTTIPADGIIRVLSGPNADGKLADKGLLYVLWEEQTVALFAVDVEARGVEIADRGAKA